MVDFLNLKDISTHRNELMGLGTILIIVCHSPANGVRMPELIEAIVRRGGIGVDLFLFLSGLGMYFSLKKRQKLKDWYIKRYVRILVPFLVFAAPYYIFRYYIDNETVWYLLCNILTISFWTHHEGAWFVAMLIPLYLLTPHLAKIIDTSQKRFLTTIILCFISAISYVIPCTNNILHNIQFCMAHVPSYFMGYWLGEFIFEGKKVDRQILILCIGLIGIYIFLCLTNIPKNWLLLLPLTIICTQTLNLRPNSVYNRLLDFMGSISLESYLMNIFFPVLLRKIGYNEFISSIDNGNYCFYATVVVVGVFVAFLGHKLCNMIIKSLSII